jgi:hypothetical protein
VQRHHLWIQCLGSNTSRACGAIASTQTQPEECRWFIVLLFGVPKPPRTTYEVVSFSISMTELLLVNLISSLVSKQPLIGDFCCIFLFPCLC